MKFRINFRLNTISKIEEGHGDDNLVSQISNKPDEPMATDHFETGSDYSSNCDQFDINREKMDFESTPIQSNNEFTPPSSVDSTDSNDNKMGLARNKTCSTFVESVLNSKIGLVVIKLKGNQIRKLMSLKTTSSDSESDSLSSSSNEEDNVLRYNEEIASDQQIDQFRSIKNEKLSKLKWDDRFVVRVLPLCDNGIIINNESNISHRIIKIKKANSAVLD